MSTTLVLLLSPCPPLLLSPLVLVFFALSWPATPAFSAPAPHVSLKRWPPEPSPARNWLLSFLVRECRHPVPGCVSARWWPVADEFQGSQGRVAEIRDRGLGGDMSLFSPDGVHLTLGTSSCSCSSTEYSCCIQQRTAARVPTIRSRHGVFVLFSKGERTKGHTANAHFTALEPLPAFRRVCPANVVKDGRLFDARSHDAGLYHNLRLSSHKVNLISRWIIIIIHHDPMSSAYQICPLPPR